MHKDILDFACVAICLAFLGGCNSHSAELAKAKADAKTARADAAAARAELAELRAERNSHGSDASPDLGAATDSQREFPQPALLPELDDDDMTTPINRIAAFTIEDYRTLPNCLDLLTDCADLPYDGKTSTQYKLDLVASARRPCRVVLKVVDIASDYDFGEFEILTDAGDNGLQSLAQIGDLGDYTRHLSAVFAVNDVKKKGLDSKALSIGDKVILVGLGHIVPASPWGASSPTHGVPRGDERQLTLRAFGMPNRFRTNDYDFAFMVRNWYIAAYE